MLVIVLSMLVSAFFNNLIFSRIAVAILVGIVGGVAIFISACYLFI